MTLWKFNDPTIEFYSGVLRNLVFRCLIFFLTQITNNNRTAQTGLSDISYQRRFSRGSNDIKKV